MKVPRDEFTFQGLCCPVGSAESADVEMPTLSYLVGLTNSPTHKISDPLTAKRILSWLYTMEEQAQNPEHLKAGEEFFGRYFDGGYQVLSPCMVVNQWSPITAMLDRGLEPIVLHREQKFRAVASGIWNPVPTFSTSEIASARTDEELFWGIIGSAFNRAVQQKKWVSVIAEPGGWLYTSAIDSLPAWSAEEVAKSGRILWKRTPEG